MKRGVWAGLAGLIVLAIVVAAIPLIASTQIVRDRIAHEMSAWSGFRVQLDEAPEIGVWPFRAVLRSVTLSPWTGEKAPPVLEAERVEIDLSPLAALRGQVVFTKARFIRPVLRLDRSEGGVYLPSLPDTGRIVRAVELGRRAVAADSARPEPAALPGDSFGVVELTGGRVVIVEDGRERELVTSLDGSVAWPALNRAGALSLKGIWRGETFAIELSSPQPLVLFGGGAAALSFSLTAAPLQASFEGSANLAQGLLDGAASLSSPSLRRVLEWSRMHIAPGAAIGAVSLEARVTGAGQRFRFQDARLSVAGNPGVGVLDFTVADGTPAIAGTLDFERLDLKSFMSAFTATPPDNAATPAEIDTSFTDQLNLDLRLSAANATAGAIALTEVAATAQVKGGLAVFDISDSTAFGGTIQVGLRLDRKPEGSEAEIRMRATGVDAAALAQAAGATRFVPQGRGAISAIFKGPATGWNAFVGAAEGTVSVKMQSGTIAGIMLPALIERAAAGGFFPLANTPEGLLPIENAELRASLADGVATIEKAQASTPQGLIYLQGIVPVIGRGLALSGTIARGEDDERLSFFIGGPWSNPFVSPIAPELPDQRW